MNAVSPEVGGVLVRGERGTAKSTAVRALAPLLPPIEAAVGETYAFGPGQAAPGGVVAAGAETEQRASPLVELPLGATLDRLVGSLDLRQALAGDHSFEPGILARAHQGILYVDEVNLLADHLVDALLDAAASGVARVEREAVSVEHDARFILVGHDERGGGRAAPAAARPLRPRRGGARAAGRGRARRDRAPPPRVRARSGGVRGALRRAGARRWRRASPPRASASTACVCPSASCCGSRARARSWASTACAATSSPPERPARSRRSTAAEEVDESHVRRAAALALPHRRRRDPLDGRQPDPEDVERALDGSPGDHDGLDGGPEDEPPPGGAPPPPPNPAGSSAGGNGSPQPKRQPGPAQAPASQAKTPATANEAPPTEAQPTRPHRRSAVRAGACPPARGGAARWSATAPVRSAAAPVRADRRRA